MSDAQDVSAIQAYLGPTSTQVSAAVANAPTLDQGLRASWYALAPRILAYVSAASPDLATGRGLRLELNALIVKLASAGLPNLPQLIRDAPPEVVAPPPVGTPNPLFGTLDTLGSLVPWALAAVVLFELGPLLKRGR